MKLLINALSLSAGTHGFKKGDRVVCKIAKNEWYIGTVTRAGTKIYVDFDDGADAVVEPEDFKHVKLMTKPKKLKRSINDAEAKALTEVEKVKPTPKAKPAPEPKPTPKPAPKAPLPIKKPSMVKPTATVKPAVKPVVKPIAPAPEIKLPEKKPAPPIVTPAPEKKLEERKFKDNWIIEIEGHGKSTWRYTVKDDPEHPTYKYRASSMVATPQKALDLALWELKDKSGEDRTKSFTITYQPPATSHEDFKVHTLEKVTIEDAEEKLSALIKSLVPAPELKKPIPVPPKTPIHQPAPTPAPAPDVKHDDRPIVEKTDFQLYLIPNHEGKWSFALKESPNNPKFFYTSEYTFDDQIKALSRALDVMPNKYLGNFTLVYVESLRGNAIDRKTIFANTNSGSAYVIVQNLFNQERQKKNEEWLLHLVNDGARIGIDNWRWSVHNYDTQKRNMGNFIMPANVVEEESDGHYKSALEAYFAAIKHVAGRSFTLRIWNGTPGNYTYNFADVDKLRAIQEIERLFPNDTENGPAPDGPSSDAPYLRCANNGLFEMAARGSDNDKMRYMADVWHRANSIIFGHNLRFPSTLRFLKEQQTSSFRRRGHWVAGKRELAMSRRVFNAGEEKFLEIFVHEMCHQAVSEIDRKIDSNKGHGPYWKAWMVKSGIPPSRYDYTDAQEYMNDAEKQKHQERLDALKQADEVKKNLRPLSNKVPLGTPAQFFWADKKSWVQGVVVGVFGTKLYICTNRDTGAYVMLPNKGVDRLFAIPAGEEKDDYMASQWQKTATGVSRYLVMEELKRKAKRTGNPLPSSFGLRDLKFL